jgi:hypothetical protein
MILKPFWGNMKNSKQRGSNLPYEVLQWRLPFQLLCVIYGKQCKRVACYVLPEDCVCSYFLNKRGDRKYKLFTFYRSSVLHGCRMSHSINILKYNTDVKYVACSHLMEISYTGQKCGTVFFQKGTLHNLHGFSKKKKNSVTQKEWVKEIIRCSYEFMWNFTLLSTTEDSIGNKYSQVLGSMLNFLNHSIPQTFFFLTPVLNLIILFCVVNIILLSV